MTEPLTAEQKARAKEIDAEYRTYVAVSEISFDGALAYRAGDPVPVSNVERHGYLDDGLVEKVKAPKASASSAPAAAQPTSTKSPEGK